MQLDGFSGLDAKPGSQNSGRLESGLFGPPRMDLTGHHSNPRRPLEALLSRAQTTVLNRLSATRAVRTTHPPGPARTVQAEHPRSGAITRAIIRVLSDHGSAMQAKAVHAGVEGLMEQPVRWATVKVLLAANVGGTSPRFQKVSRGKYRLSEGRI